MDDSVNLLYLYNEDNEILFKTYESFVGWDANVILEEVMNTSSVNQDIKRMIDEMYKCIEDKKYDEAEKIVDILDKKTHQIRLCSYLQRHQIQYHNLHISTGF